MINFTEGQEKSKSNRNQSISICQNSNSTFHILNFIEKIDAYLAMYSAIFHIRSFMLKYNPEYKD